MKLSIAVFVSAMIWSVNPTLSADADGVTDAQRIVVITNDEGIHYQHGCGFYELRNLIAKILRDTADDKQEGPPLFELRLIGINKIDTIYVGDHWIATGSTRARVTAADFDRLVDMIESRVGAGVPQARIEASVRLAAKRINDPTYVEENRCQNEEV